MGALTLRMEVLDSGAWRYHVARADLTSPCGVWDTETCGDPEHTEALRLLLGHVDEGASWCPACRRELVAGFAAL